MTRLVESWSARETLPTGNPIKHQTPLAQGCRGISEEIIQQDLIIVGNKVNVKEIDTDIIEFEALALVQGPVVIY